MKHLFQCPLHIILIIILVQKNRKGETELMYFKGKTTDLIKEKACEKVNGRRIKHDRINFRAPCECYKKSLTQ